MLARPRFAGRIDSSRAAAVLVGITAHGVDVGVANSAPFALPDPDDQPFLDVAIAGTASAIVTGNMRHFPAECGVAIVNPTGLIAMLRPTA